MENYKKYLAVAGLLVLAFLGGRYSSPARTELEKTSQTEVSQNKNQDVVEIIRETHKPDGTIIKETRKEKETSIQTQKETSKSLTQITENRPLYRLGVLYEPPIKGFQDQNYSGMIERRLFSEFYAGISVSSQKTVGVVLSFGF